MDILPLIGGSVCLLSHVLIFFLPIYWKYVVRPGRDKKLRLQWQAVSDKLDLTADLSGPSETWTMRGVLADCKVLIKNHDDGEGVVTLIEVQYPQRLAGLLQSIQPLSQPSLLKVLKTIVAPDVQVGVPSFDAQHRIYSTAPTLLQALFTDAGVSEWARAYSPMSQYNVPRLTKTGIQALRSYVRTDTHDHLEETLQESISLITLFTDALDRFADTLAARTGLTIVAEIPRNLPRFEGVRQGVAIDLRQPADGDGLQLTATIPTPVTAALTIVAKEADQAPASVDGVPMLDPILDAHVTVSTEEVEAARALLRQDQTREDLMALMMTHPNARVMNGVVSLHVPTVDPDTVAAALDDMVSLASSLSADRQEQPSAAGQRAARAQTTS